MIIHIRQRIKKRFAAAAAAPPLAEQQNAHVLSVFGQVAKTL